MDRAGVELSVLSLSSPGTHFGDDRAARAPTREVNEFAAALGQAHPGRVGHLATLPLPDVEGALEEASYALDVLGAERARGREQPPRDLLGGVLVRHPHIRW